MMEKAHDYLEVDRIHHIDMLETLDRKIGDVIYADDDGVLIYNKPGETYMLSTESFELLQKMCDLIKETSVVTTHQPQFVPYLKERFNLTETMECFHSAYLTDNLINEQIPEGIEFRKLTLSEFDFVFKNYNRISDADYLADRINSGMIGAFSEGEPVGFIGTHSEGAMGMLQLLPDFRRRGIAFSLEAALINQMVKLGQIPYGQIVTTNSASIGLQKKLGMSLSDKTIVWVFK